MRDGCHVRIERTYVQQNWWYCKQSRNQGTQQAKFVTSHGFCQQNLEVTIGDQSTTICPPRSCLMGPAEAEALGPVVAVPLCQALAAASARAARAWILFALVRLAQFSSCHQQLLDAGLVDLLTSTAEPGEGETGTSGRAGVLWLLGEFWRWLGVFWIGLELGGAQQLIELLSFLSLLVERFSGIWFCFDMQLVASLLGSSQRKGQTCWPTTSWPLYLRLVAAK